jgi:hypothetical protein
MSILDAFPNDWRTDVTITGPIHRDADGYLTTEAAPRTITGALIAPGTAPAPGLNTTQPNEATDATATLYAPPGAPIHHRDRVTIPTSHPLAGTWTVESDPAPWPLGTVATITRR